MNNPENFLTRWSRRKHAAALERNETVPTVAPSAAPLVEKPGNEVAAATERLNDDSGIFPSTGVNTTTPPFDPLTLPSIESITADTDIRCFLAPGVPPELTRAALRRAWATDPRIRDFVGLADYDWDFNAPDSMAGFGSLEMTDELRRMAARIVGPVSDDDESAVMRDTAHATSDQISGEPGLAQPVQDEIGHTQPAQDALIVKPSASCRAGDLPPRDQEGEARLP